MVRISHSMAIRKYQERESENVGEGLVLSVGMARVGGLFTKKTFEQRFEERKGQNYVLKILSEKKNCAI